MQTGSDRITLFWTAGFDSTFRLLDLLARGDVAVRPVYLIDPQRASYSMELARIQKMRAMIADWAPAPDKLLPIEIYLRNDYPVEADLRDAFAEIKRTSPIGGQYFWLAQFCRTKGFADGQVELCMPRHDPPSQLQRTIFDDPLSEAPRIRPGAPWTLFRYYSFPLLGTLKSEMRPAAERKGFGPILAESWFCHSPVRGRPCGFCNPCGIAKQEREGIVFSRRSMVRHYSRRVLRQIRRARAQVGGSLVLSR